MKVSVTGRDTERLQAKLRELTESTAALSDHAQLCACYLDDMKRQICLKEVQPPAATGG